MVDSFRISEEISLRIHLGNNWSISHDFSLDTILLLGQTEVNYFVDLVFESAVVFNEMSFRAGLILGLLSGIAALLDKTFAFSPRKDLVNRSTFASFRCFGAIEEFLSR